VSDSVSDSEGGSKGEASKRKPKAALLPQYTPEFDEFWKAYPRREAKKTAFASYEAALSAGIAATTILDGAKRYAATCSARRVEASKIAHPSTWLNQARWDDDYTIAKKEWGTGGL
jgi:hypothetical protein